MTFDVFCFIVVALGVFLLLFIIATIKRMKKVPRFEVGRYATPDGNCVIEVLTEGPLNYIAVNGWYAFIFNRIGFFEGTDTKFPSNKEVKAYYADYDDGKAGDARTSRLTTIVTNVPSYKDKEVKP